MVKLATLGLIIILSSWANSRDIPSIAFDITLKDMSKADWEKHVQKAQRDFDTWISDNPTGNLKRFLDDRLLQYGTWAVKGKISHLKKFIYWLPLYKEWKEQLPKYICEITEENWEDLNKLLSDWSWEKAHKLIKRKSKEHKEKKK